MERYKIDVCCLQETKLKDGIDTTIQGYRFISLPSTSKYYGNGFIVSPKWTNYIHSYWKVSDRISVLQLTTPSSKIKNNSKPMYRTVLNGMKLKISKNIPADHVITIINVYAPTTTRVKKNMKVEYEDMYVQLTDMINNFNNISTSIVFIAGDLNAKVGKSTNTGACLGRFSRINNSGETLVQFCEANGLFICNSAFQHPARHMAVLITLFVT